MVSRIGGVQIDLGLESAAFRREAQRATAELSKGTAQMRLALRGVDRASKDLGRQFGQIKSAAVALAGVLAVRQFTQFTRAAIDNASALKDQADKVGLSTMALQQLRFAAEQTGVAQNTLDMAMQRFSRRLGEVAQGQGELLKTAQQYNVQIRDSEGRMRSNIDILKDFSEVMRNAESDQERLRIGFKLFDSEGAALANTLKNGRVALEAYMEQAVAFGAVMSEQVIARGKLASDALAALERVYRTSFDTAIIEGFAGSVTASADALKTAQRIGETFGEAVATSMRTLADAAQIVARNMGDIAAVAATLIGYKLAVVIGGIASATWTWITALKAAIVAGTGLNAVLKLNPIIAVVSTLAGGFLLLRDNFQGATDAAVHHEDALKRIHEATREANAATGDQAAELLKVRDAQIAAAVAIEENIAAMKRQQAERVIAQTGLDRGLLAAVRAGELDPETARSKSGQRLPEGIRQALAGIQALDKAIAESNARIMELREGVDLTGEDLATVARDAGDAVSEAAAKVAKETETTLEFVRRVKAEMGDQLAKRFEDVRDELKATNRDLGQQLQILKATGPARDAIRRQIALQAAAEKAGVSIGTEKARVLADQLDLAEQQRAEIKKLTEAEAEAARKAEQALEDQRRMAERQAEIMARPFENALDGIQGAFSDMFVNVFSGGVSTFADLAASVKRIMIQLAAEVATLLVFKPAVGGPMRSVSLASLSHEMELAPCPC